MPIPISPLTPLRYFQNTPSHIHVFSRSLAFLTLCVCVLGYMLSASRAWSHKDQKRALDLLALEPACDATLSQRVLTLNSLTIPYSFLAQWVQLVLYFGMLVGLCWLTKVVCR